MESIKVIQQMQLTFSRLPFLFLLHKPQPLPKSIASFGISGKPHFPSVPGLASLIYTVIYTLHLFKHQIVTESTPWQLTPDKTERANPVCIRIRVLLHPLHLHQLETFYHSEHMVGLPRRPKQSRTN